MAIVGSVSAFATEGTGDTSVKVKNSEKRDTKGEI